MAFNKAGGVRRLRLRVLCRTWRRPRRAIHGDDLGGGRGQKVSGGYGLNSLGQAAACLRILAARCDIVRGRESYSLGTLVAGDVSIAEAISSTGQVVRYVVEYPGGNTVFHAFLYSNGNMQDIHSASLFPSGTVAYGIIVPSKWWARGT